jgi:endoglucanase
MASGGDNIDAINTSPPVEAYILYGAVVGGPNSYDRFYDIRSDWPETEVALDYNAPLLTLAAMQVANSSAVDPYYTRLQAGEYEQHKPKGQPCDAAMTCSRPKLSKGGEIAMAVVISVVGVAVLGLGMLSLVKGLGRQPRPIELAMGVKNAA